MSARPVAEVRGMAPCPGCGVLLDGSLVAAIKDPRREESCPKRPSRPGRAKTVVVHLPQPSERYVEAVRGLIRDLRVELGYEEAA